MVCSCGVGITHWEARDGQPPSILPGAKPKMFFAPDQIQKRNQDWGPQKFQAELSAAWHYESPWEGTKYIKDQTDLENDKKN